MANVTNIISGFSNTVASSYNTVSITPEANKVYLLMVGVSRTGVGNAPSASGAGLTFTQVNTVANGNCRCSILRAITTSPSAAAITISFAGESQSNCYWILDRLDGVVTTGTNGANAIVQSATNSSASGGSTTGITVTLGAFNKIQNITYGAVAQNDSKAISPGSGFTELAEVGQFHYNETEWKPSNDTSVDWTWAASSGAKCAVAVEINAQKLAGNGLMFGSGLTVG